MLTIDHKKTLLLLFLYVLVGVVAGIGAILFQQLLSIFNILVLEGIAGYTEVQITSGFRRFTLPWMRPELRIWLFPILTGTGGLISGLIIYRFAPEAAGHGTDDVIQAYHRYDGKVRFRVSVVKMISAVITIGSGGSGGKEGPISQIGAGLGSFICTRIPFYQKYRKEIMLAGMAAGIAAIFRAPLAGALFAAEILHSDMRYDGKVLIPGVIASTVAYGIYSLYFGVSPVLTVPHFSYNFSLIHLIPFTALGFISALAAVLFVKVYYFTRDVFCRLRIKPYLKPALGGVVTGLIALRFSSAMGEGSFQMQQMLDGEMAIVGMALLFLIKMVTTSSSIASGGSGGTFGPSLFIGSAMGGAFAGLYLYLFPGSGIPITVFILLGMVGFFAGAANAPLSTVIFVAEMTGVFTLLGPFLWVAIFGYIFSQRWNIYEHQLPLKSNSLEVFVEEDEEQPEPKVAIM